MRPALLAFGLLSACARHAPPVGAQAPLQRSTPAWELIRRHTDGVAVIAHRGASAFAPENTLAAYAKAVEQGAGAAETDLRLTADRRVVLLHDATLDRTTDGTGPVDAMPLDAARTLDAGSWFDPAFSAERLPELGEFLDAFGRSMVLCLEIKAGLGIERQVQQAIDARGLRGNVVIFSFNGDKVALSKQLLPDVPALLLAGPTGEPPVILPRVVDDARAIGADALGLWYKATTPELIERAHAAGLPVFVYTVDDPAEARAMAALGVDGIITNDVPAIVAALAVPPG